MAPSSTLQLAVAIALARSKPPGKSTRAYLEDIRLALLAASHSAVGSSITSTGAIQLNACLPSSSEPGPSTRLRPQPLESEPRASSSSSVDQHVHPFQARIKYLEQQLERAEAEADQAKLALLSRPELPPTLSTTELDATATATKKKNGKRKAGDAALDSSEPANKKRKRKGAANADALGASESRSAIMSSKVSLEELLPHIEVDLPVPSTRSSLGVLSSLESHIRALESGSQASREQPQISLHSHLSRSVSSLARLILSILGLHDPNDNGFTHRPETSSSGSSLSTARTTLRIAGSILHRVMLLGNCWTTQDGTSEEQIENSAELVVQVAEAIIIPLIGAYHVLSTRYAEDAFGVSLSTPIAMAPHPRPQTTNSGPLDASIDSREEITRVLVLLLDPSTQSSPRSRPLPAPVPAPAPLQTSALAPIPSNQPTQRIPSDNFAEFIPLSGTTAASSSTVISRTPTGVATTATNGETQVVPANLWFGDIIAYVAAAELVRISRGSDDALPPPSADGTTGRRDGAGPSGAGERPQAEKDRQAILRIVREETVWHLCSLVQACTRAREDRCKGGREKDGVASSGSSAEVMRGARDVLTDVLLVDHLAQQPSEAREEGKEKDLGKSVWGAVLEPDASATRGQLLGFLEREMILASVELLNACCEEPWEEDHIVEEGKEVRC